MSTINRTRFCIFCGNPPSEKTKEHIIPQWLIELTGDPKRMIQIGPFLSNEEPLKHIPFDQFQFPACRKCNGFYSDLENRAKTAITKMLDLDKTSDQDWDVLLDWFDKVRIGLWLGYHQFFDKNIWNIKPNFHIADRIGTTDRLLMIYRTQEAPKRVNFACVDTPSFAHSPTCFTLIINNLFFLNISTDFILSKRAGLPYPESISTRGDNKLVVPDQLLPGTEKLRYPIFGYKHDQRCTIIAQPIFGKYTSTFAEAYESSFVKGSTFTTKKIKPILQQKGRVNFYPQEESSEWIPEEIVESKIFLYLSTIQTLQLQNELMRRIPVWQQEDKFEKRRMRFKINQCIKINGGFVSRIKARMKAKDIESL